MIISLALIIKNPLVLEHEDIKFSYLTRLLVSSLFVFDGMEEPYLQFLNIQYFINVWIYSVLQLRTI